MSHWIPSIVFVMALCGSLSSVQAQEVPAEKQALIDRMMASMNIEATVDQMVEVMTEQVVNRVKRTSPGIKQDAIDIIVEVVEEEGRLLVEQALSDATPIMAKLYTTDELEQLVAFYETPLGQKALKSMPEVMREIQARMPPRLQNFQQRVAAKLQKRLEAAGYQ
ncbi:DUF2059 domain-containing protein [Pacificispira sp.]|uniref:DUF2059 domain-containing protein n=1 Tax=Pacificispira sp. TaxID=2888761 RepID=UPI003BAA0219